jgi:hypothetical protein
MYYLTGKKKRIEVDPVPVRRPPILHKPRDLDMTTEAVGAWTSGLCLLLFARCPAAAAYPFCVHACLVACVLPDALRVRQLHASSTTTDFGLHSRVLQDRVADNLASALELKEVGNKLFAAKEYTKAIAKYTKVFAYANGLKMPAAGGPEGLLMSGKAPIVTKQQVRSQSASNRRH